MQAPTITDLTGAPIPWVDVYSTNVRRVLWRYEGATAYGNEGALYIQFRSGAVYQYDGVRRAVYDELLAADSVGGYVARHLKGHYATTRVPLADDPPEEGRGPGEMGTFVRRMVQPEDDPNYSHGGGGGPFGRNAGWE